MKEENNEKINIQNIEVIPVKEKAIRSLKSYLGDNAKLRWNIGYDPAKQMFSSINSLKGYEYSEYEKTLPSPNRLFFEFQDSEITVEYDFFTEDYNRLIDLAKKAKDSESYALALDQAISIAKKFLTDLKNHPEFNDIVAQLIPKTFFNESSYTKTQPQKIGLLEDAIGAAFAYRILQVYIANRPNAGIEEERYGFVFLTKVLNYLPGLNEGTSQYSQIILYNELKEYLLEQRAKIIEGKETPEFVPIEKEVEFNSQDMQKISKEPMEKEGCSKGTLSKKKSAKQLFFGPPIENVYFETKEKVPVVIEPTGNDTIRIAPKRRTSVLKFDFSGLQDSINNEEENTQTEDRGSNLDLSKSSDS